MARITERGLRRSVGVPGLFATAYGNVGSSIYYALGLVALHALGLTPVPATQVIARDRHADFLYACASIAATCETVAVELRHLQRTEVLEVE